MDGAAASASSEEKVMFQGYVPTESDEQETVIQWKEVAMCVEPRLELLYAIPNGEWRHPATAARLKAEGVVSGVPDLCLPVSDGVFHGLYIEMKKRDHSNRPSKNQKRFIKLLSEQGYRVEVAYGSDEAIDILQGYLGMPSDQW